MGYDLKANEYLELIKIYKKTSKETIIKNIRLLIKQHNIKCKNQYLAKICNIPVNTVNMWFKETNKPTLENLCKITIALNEPIVEILKI